MKWLYRKTLCYNIQCYFYNLVSISSIASFPQSYWEHLLEHISKVHRGASCFFAKVCPENVHLDVFRFSNIISACSGTISPEKRTCCSTLTFFIDLDSSFFFPSLTHFFFHFSGAMKLLLRSHDNSNAPPLHLPNMYAFGHKFTKVPQHLLSFMVNAAPSLMHWELSTLVNIFLHDPLKALQQTTSLFPCTWHCIIPPEGRVVLFESTFCGETS